MKNRMSKIFLIDFLAKLILIGVAFAMFLNLQLASAFQGPVTDPNQSGLSSNTPVLTTADSESFQEKFSLKWIGQILQSLLAN